MSHVKCEDQSELSEQFQVILSRKNGFQTKILFTFAVVAVAAADRPCWVKNFFMCLCFCVKKFDFLPFWSQAETIFEKKVA